MALIGKYYLIVLDNKGNLYSKTKKKDLSFKQIKLNKPLKFKYYHSKRIPQRVVYITCDNNYFNKSKCYAITNNDDIFMWKPPSITATYIANIPGLLYKGNFFKISLHFSFL